MPIIEKHHVHPFLFHSFIGGTSRWDANHAVRLPRTGNRLVDQEIYRTPVSGVLRRKDSGFAVCGENLASVSRFVAGIRHSSRMLRSLCKNERQLMSRKETLLSGSAAACATRAQQLERTAALLSYRSGRREPQRSVSEGAQDRLKRSLMNSGSHPDAVLGPGAIARCSTTTRRSTSPFR
jgi:hypothetical protein